MSTQFRIAQVEPPVPNNVGPECICVPKVYDWVVITEDINTTVTVPASIPAGCPCVVTDVTCSLGSPPFFPISCVGDGSTIVLDRRPANIDGVNAHIVKLRQQIPVNITFTGTDAAGAPTSCTIPVEASFIHQVILCFPDEFGDENLVSRIVSGDCTITTPPPAEGEILPTSIGLELLLCIEIQVLASVKLEVLAKFCSPRPPVPITAQNVCPPLIFPQQCDFFPQPNCNCASTVNNTCTVGADGLCTLTLDGLAIDAGTHTLQATICNSCAPVNTIINYSFTSAVDPSNNFTFTANTFTSETCTPVLPFIHTITGVGTVTNSSGSFQVNYLLVLTETPVGLPDTYVLTLTGVVPPFAAVASNLNVPDEDLVITNCTQFPVTPTIGPTIPPTEPPIP